jgi:hypothetical protein
MRHHLRLPRPYRPGTARCLIGLLKKEIPIQSSYLYHLKKVHIPFLIRVRSVSPSWDSLGKAKFSNGTLYGLPLLFEKIRFGKSQNPLTTAMEQTGGYMDQPRTNGIRLFAKAFFVIQPHHPDQKIVCQDAGLKDTWVSPETLGENTSRGHLILTPLDPILAGCPLPVAFVCLPRRKGEIGDVTKELGAATGKA